VPDRIGNIRQQEALRRAVTHGAHHAILLTGIAQVGKRSIARDLVQENIGNASMEAHPDVCVITPDTEKAIPTIGIGEVRTLRAFLSLRSLGERKFLIIDDVHLMTNQAANALLKSLEEPPPGTVIFLITSQSGALLPTIRSRALELHFAPVADDAIVNWLEKEHGLDAKTAKSVTDMAYGRPGLAKRLSEDTEAQASLHRRESAVAQLLKAPQLTRLAYIARVEKQAPEAIRELPEQWLPTLRTALRQGEPNAPAFTDALFTAMERFTQGTSRPALYLDAAMLTY